MANRPKISQSKRLAILARLKEGWTVQAACADVGLDPVTFYKLIRSDQFFAAEVKEADAELDERMLRGSKGNILAAIEMGDQAASKYYMNYQQRYELARLKAEQERQSQVDFDLAARKLAEAIRDSQEA